MVGSFTGVICLGPGWAYGSLCGLKFADEFESVLSLGGVGRFLECVD